MAHAEAQLSDAASDTVVGFIGYMPINPTIAGWRVVDDGEAAFLVLAAFVALAGVTTLRPAVRSRAG